MAMGEISGVRLWTVRDKGKGLIDLKMAFTVKIDPRIVMFGFTKLPPHPTSAADKDASKRAVNATEEAKRLTRTRDHVAVIGKDASKTKSIAPKIDEIVPNYENPASISIGQVDRGRFSVRLTIKHDDPTKDFSLQVPFEGDPGPLNDQSITGTAFHVAESSVDVGKATVELYNVADSP